MLARFTIALFCSSLCLSLSSAELSLRRAPSSLNNKACAQAKLAQELVKFDEKQPLAFQQMMEALGEVALMGTAPELAAKAQQQALLKSLGINEPVARACARFDLAEGSPASKIKQAIDEALQAKIAAFNNAYELLSLMQTLQNHGYPNNHEYLTQQSLWARQGFITPEWFKKAPGPFKPGSEQNFVDLWRYRVSTYSLQVESAAQLRLLIALLKQTPTIDQKIYHSYLSQTPYLKRARAKYLQNVTPKILASKDLIELASFVSRLKSNELNQLRLEQEDFFNFIAEIKRQNKWYLEDDLLKTSFAQEHGITKQLMTELSRSLASTPSERLNSSLVSLHAKVLWSKLEFINVKQHEDFYHAIVELVKNDQLSFIQNLANSPFAEKYGITRPMLKSLAESLSMISKSELNSAEAIAHARAIWAEELNTHMLGYDVELSTPPVRNQCEWGSCTFHGFVAQIEIEMQALGQARPDLSLDYLYYHHLMAEYQKMAFNLNYQIAQSIHYKELVNLLGDKGILPQSAWTPIKSLHAPGMRELLEQKIQVLKSSYSAAPESMELTARFNQEIKAIFEQLFGTPPDTFEFNGSTYSAQSFAEAFLPESFRSAHPDQTKFNYYLRNVLHVISGEDTDLKAYPTHLDFLTRKIKTSIDHNQAIYVSVYWTRLRTYPFRNTQIPYIDLRTGKLTAPNTLPSNFNFRNADDSVPLHAMIIVGYKLDAFGSVIQLKLLNSHGTELYDQGIVHMDLNYFKHFLRMAQFKTEDP